MKYIELPNGKQMSKIGLGVSRFGTKLPVEMAEEQLACFLNNGGTLLDTARNYYEWVDNGRGQSEKFIGKWLEKYNCREQVVISTKGGVRNEGKSFFINLSRENLSSEIQESLDALRTDYVDIYLLHRDEPERRIEEIVDTLQHIREICHCSKLGVCNWNPDRIMRANEYAYKNGLTPIEIIQTWWSVASYKKEMWNDPTTTHMDSKTYSYCMKHNCIAMGYTSQAKGFFQKAYNCSINELDPLLCHRIVNEANLRKLEEIRRFCKKEGTTPTDVVMGYITSNPLRGVALVSCSKCNQLQQILESSDYCLDFEEIKRLDSCAAAT